MVIESVTWAPHTAHFQAQCPHTMEQPHNMVIKSLSPSNAHISVYIHDELAIAESFIEYISTQLNIYAHFQHHLLLQGTITPREDLAKTDICVHHQLGT